jgi:hypothetical protein
VISACLPILKLIKMTRLFKSAACQSFLPDIELEYQQFTQKPN